MTKDSTPLALWDSLNDEQKVEFLATKVMGWHSKKLKGCDCEYWHRSDGACVCGAKSDYACDMHDCFWNPLTDWNHWRQVEEKIMEDDKDGMKLFAIVNYAAAPKGLNSWHTRNSAWWNYCKADLPARCKSLYLASQSLHE